MTPELFLAVAIAALCALFTVVMVHDTIVGIRRRNLTAVEVLAAAVLVGFWVAGGVAVVGAVLGLWSLL